MLADFLYHGPESSTSTEPSPIFERKSFPGRGRPKYENIYDFLGFSNFRITEKQITICADDCDKEVWKIGGID